MASGLSVDIENEFISLRREIERLSEVLPDLDENRDDAMHWMAIAGVATTITGIYTGCERIMALLAKHVDGSPLDSSDGGWHRMLLNRMSNPFGGARGPIITQACHDGLDRFRSFRHRQRINYSIDLDPGIVLERAAELGPVFQSFQDDVMSFLADQPEGRN